MGLPSTNDAFVPVTEHDRLSPTLSESHAATALPHTLSAAPAGLEVDTRVIYDNQGIQHPEKSLSPHPINLRQKNDHVEPHGSGKKSRKLCGLKVSLCWIVLIGVLAIGLAVGLGVGLGLGLRTSKAQDTGALSFENIPLNATGYRTGGSLDPSYYSTSGAWNGSGIYFSYTTLPGLQQDTAEDSLVLYFQHHSGEIRWMRRDPAGTWIGASSSDVVATDARNGTRIIGLDIPAVDGVAKYHIFYIDKNDTIRQRTNDNVTNNWSDGPLGNANLKVNDADLASFTVCWLQYNSMILYFASDNTTLQEYESHDESGGWSMQRSWSGYSGVGGIGCPYLGDHNETYTAFINSKDEVEIWWKDQSTGTNDTAVWTQTDVVIPGVYPASDLRALDFLYVQMADTFFLQAYNITYDRGDTRVLVDKTFTVQDKPGTQFSEGWTWRPAGNSTITALHVAYQTNGSDISIHSRDVYRPDSDWSFAELPIPNE